MIISWLRFEWDLAQLPADAGKSLPPFVLRPADKADEEVVKKVAISAFSMDTGWGDVRTAISEKMSAHIASAFDKEPPACVVLQHGARIIGVSVLDRSENADNHLLTGPCILHEYRSRGLASLLLKASLDTLRTAGLKHAYGIARDKTAAARFVYPKFGSKSEPWTQAFEVTPKLAA